MNERNVIHWLRTRQEESELGFWLSLVSYDRKDQSVVNRAYLIYLIIFFSGWIFLTLTLLASGGAIVLQAILPGRPEQAAIGVLVLILASWWLFGMLTYLNGKYGIAFSYQYYSRTYSGQSMNEYVTKPIDQDSLFRTLIRCICRKN